MTTATLTLTEFLLARIAEDEREATACLDQYMRGDGGTKSRWMRQLAECEAKRRIVEDYEALVAVAHLALPYADHPDYRPEWRP